MKKAKGRFVDGLKKAKRRGNRKRWRSATQVYEEDTQHGDLEKYNKRGKRLGSVDPDTGEIVKPPVKGRTIEP